MGSHIKNAIEQMQRKEEAGLNYLYSKTFNYVYLRAKSLLKKESDVQKLMKEVYSQAFASAAELKEEEIYEWLGKRTYSIGNKYFRRKKAREATTLEFEKSDLASGKNGNNDSVVEALSNVLEQLPEVYQATFYAFYYDFMSVADIAEMMDCTVGVILHRLNYTAKFLKEAFAMYNEEAGNKKEKAVFTVESICHALRKWSVEHCLGMASAQTLYANLCKELGLKAGPIHFEGVEFAGVNNTVVYHKADDMSLLLEEIELYSPKEKVDKKKYAIIGAVAVALVLIIVIFAIIFGGNEKEQDGSDSEGTKVELDETQDAADDTEEDASQNDTVEDESNQDDAAQEGEVEEPEQGADESTESEYILPTSNTVALTESDLQSMSRADLRLARNEIYARYGMIFGVDDLDSYFATKSWYEPKYTTDSFYDHAELSPVEEANVQLILSIERNMQ